MNNNDKNGKQIAKAATEPPVANAPVNNKPAARDPRGFGYYAFDKTLDTVTGGVKHWDEEKPGTSRKIAGVAATGIGGTIAGIGIYLLVS